MQVIGCLVKPRARLTGRWRRLLLFISRPSLSDSLAFDFWLGGGIPLDPDNKGRQDNLTGTSLLVGEF